MDKWYLVSCPLVPFLGVLGTEGQRVAIRVPEGGSCLQVAPTQHMEGSCTHSKAALAAESNQRVQQCFAESRLSSNTTG